MLIMTFVGVVRGLWASSRGSKHQTEGREFERNCFLVRFAPSPLPALPGRLAKENAQTLMLLISARDVDEARAQRMALRSFGRFLMGLV